MLHSNIKHLGGQRVDISRHLNSNLNLAHTQVEVATKFNAVFFDCLALITGDSKFKINDKYIEIKSNVERLKFV